MQQHATCTKDVDHCIGGEACMASIAVRNVQHALNGLNAVKAGDPSPEALDAVAASLLYCLQDGLKGNRAVTGNIWSVVLAATRAFPIQLSPSVEKAQTVVEATNNEDIVSTWVLQAAADGSLIVLVQLLRSQPQIATAYSKGAMLRDPQAAEQLVVLLQELQGLLQAPYDTLVCKQSAAATASWQPAAAPIHVETEDDHPQYAHHNAAATADAARPARAAAQLSTTHQPAHGQAYTPPALVGGSHDSKSNSSVIAVEEEQQIKLQILVVPAPVSDPPSSNSSSCAEHFVVQLHLEVTDVCNRSSNGIKSSGSSSSFLGSKADAVRGLLQGLHHSASAGLQQSTAAGQELTGAVAAAGGAVVAAISNPIAAVRSLAGKTQRKVERSKAAASSTAASANAAAHPAASVAADGTAGAAVQVCKGFHIQLSAADGWTQRSGRRMPAFLSRRQDHASPATAAVQSATAAAAAAAQPAATTAAATTTSMPPDSGEVLRVQLVVLEDPAASDQLVQLTVVVVHDGSSTGDSSMSSAGFKSKGRSGSAANSASKSWQGGALLHRFSRKGSSSSKEASEPGGEGSSQIKYAASKQASSRDTVSADEAALGDVLEGDIWSVMARLKGAGNSILAPSSAAVTGSGEGGSANTLTAEAALAQQLQQQGEDLLQQLLAVCNQVSSVAAQTKGCLGEDCLEMLKLLHLMTQLLNHGLCNAMPAGDEEAPAQLAAGALAAGAQDKSGSAGGGTAKKPQAPAAVTAVAGVGSVAHGMTLAARGKLSGWLGGKPVTAFGVLLALQHGSKQHPRLLLGADGIARLKTAKSAPPSMKLDMWLRASLNEQLLGSRLSMLAGNPAALAPWYQPQALLLQHQLMQQLLLQLSQLCSHRYALPVDSTTTGAPAGGPAAAEDTASRPSSSSSSTATALDPRRLLGGFTAGLGAFGGFVGAVSTPSGSSTASRKTAAAGTDQPGAELQPPAAAEGNNSSNSIPTFLWTALGGASGSNHSSSSQMAAAEAAGESGEVGREAPGGFFKRRRQPAKVPQIAEVRVPPPDSAAVLSPEASCALSPVSTAGDAAYAEWWDPSGSWQDLASGRSGSGTSRGSAGVGGESADTCQQDVPWQACASRSVSGSSLSEAAQKLEQDLAAAMSSSLLLGCDSAGSRRSSSTGGAGPLVLGSSSIDGRLSVGSSQRDSPGSDTAMQQRQQQLHRSSSAGWDAAVARARRSNRTGPVPGAAWGVAGTHYARSTAGSLYRRSRSPEHEHLCPGPGAVAPGAVAAPGAAGQGSSGCLRPNRHRHKRSSSLNDLPELAALLDAGDGRQDMMH